MEADGAGTTSSNMFANQGSIPGTGSTSNVFGSAEFYLPNYSGNKLKTMMSNVVNEGNVNSISTVIRATAAVLSDTNAITTIRVVDSGGGFVSGSRFDLYGISNT
jgi:hypothetical protein